MHQWCLPFITIAVVLVVFGCQSEIDEGIAARVNGRAIALEDLGIVEESRDQTEQNREQNQALKERLLEQLIEVELVVQEAERKGITVSDEELQQKIDEIKRDFPEQTFRDMLVKEYIDYDAWREKTRRSLLVEKTTLSELSSRITMDPKELEAAFEERSAMQARPHRFLVRHVTTTDKNQAEQALRRLQAGEDFQAVADDLAGPVKKRESAEKYWVYLDRLPRDMAQAIAGTSQGQVSEIVESEFGFTIFQILEIERLNNADPASVLMDVNRLYWARRRVQAYDSWMQELKSKAAIVINPSLAKAAEMHIKSDQTR